MSVSFTALTALAQNGYTITDFTAVNTEYMIDDVLDTVNLLADQSIAAMTGTAGTKTASVTRAQAPVVKMLLSLVLRENKKTSLTNSSATGGSSGGSKSVSVNNISVSESSSISSSISAASAINSEANSIYVQLFLKACEKLRMASALPPIYVSNAPIPLE